MFITHLPCFKFFTNINKMIIAGHFVENSTGNKRLPFQLNHWPTLSAVSRRAIHWHGDVNYWTLRNKTTNAAHIINTQPSVSITGKSVILCTQPLHFSPAKQNRTRHIKPCFIFLVTICRSLCRFHEFAHRNGTALSCLYGFSIWAPDGDRLWLSVQRSAGKTIEINKTYIPTLKPFPF